MKKFFLLFAISFAMCAYLVAEDITYTEVNVTAMSNRSALEATMGESALSTVTALKVTGSINAYDIMVLNNKTVALKHLDLTDANILATAGGYEYYTGYTTQDSVLTGYSFRKANVKLETLLLPRSLKSIADNACYGHSTLKSVTIQHNGSIGNSAFQNCTALTTIEGGEGITSIGSNAFSVCSSLQAIVIGDNVTSVGQYAFESCTSVNSIYVGKNVSTVGSSAFRYCKGVKKIEWNAKNCSWPQNNYYDDEANPFYFRVNNSGYNSYTLDSLIIGDSVEVIPNYFLYTRFGSSSSGSITISNVIIGNHIKRIGTKAFVPYSGNLSYTKLSYTGEPKDWLKIEFYDNEANPIYIAGHLYIADTLLTNLVIPEEIENVNDYAFYNCASLKSVTCSNALQSIGSYAFKGCSNLDTIAFGTGLKMIDSYAFQSCSSLKNFRLPTGLETIGSSAFSGCFSLTEFRIPSSVRTVGEGAFSGCNNLQNVYTYTVEPTSINQNTFSCWTTAMLNIPYTSRFIYWYNTQWSQFTHSQEFSEPYDYFYANGDIELGGETGTIDGDPDVDLNPGAGLIVEGTDEQSLDSITVHGNDQNVASIVSCDNLKANKMVVKLALKAKTWYFFCFPWDILVDHLELKGRFAIREYDGAIRAANGSGGWQNLSLTTGNKLHKGRGYILNAEKNDTLTIRIQHPTFDCNNAETSISAYLAANSFDAGWNLIGNLFASYFSLDWLFDLGFTMPVIVWNGHGYETYRPGDDDYHFRPFEGFFIQQSGYSSLIFDALGRETYTQSLSGGPNHAPRAKYAKTEATERKLINLTLSDDDYTDRARIVFNPAATDEYEQGVDAAKFMSTTASVQLYSLDGLSQAYAINERPATEEVISLGYSVRESGEYTLSAPRMDAPVVIYDNEAMVNVDLSQGDYTFYTEAGTNNTRFSVRRAPEIATSIDEALSRFQNTPVDVYTVAGLLLHRQVMLSDVQLEAGVYVVSGNNRVEKLIIR